MWVQERSAGFKCQLTLVVFAHWPGKARIRSYTPPLRLGFTLVVLVAALIGPGDCSAIMRRRRMLTGFAANASGTVPS